MYTPVIYTCHTVTKLRSSPYFPQLQHVKSLFVCCKLNQTFIELNSINAPQKNDNES